jgi:hypothetical protein
MKPDCPNKNHTHKDNAGKLLCGCASGWQRGFCQTQGSPHVSANHIHGATFPKDCKQNVSDDAPSLTLIEDFG